MRDTTDLDAIKNAAIELIDTPFEVYHDVWVKHPLFEMIFIPDIYAPVDTDPKDRRILDITVPEDYEIACRNKKRRLLESPDVVDIFLQIRAHYKFSFLKKVEPFLSLDDFSHTLADVWSDSANDPLPTKTIIKMFLKADKTSLMTDEERAVLDGLPDPIHVYRGESVGFRRTYNKPLDAIQRRMSWTLNRDTAVFFATQRVGKGYVLEGLAPKSQVLAFFNDRPEQEIVIAYRYVKNIKETYAERDEEVEDADEDGVEG